MFPRGSEQKLADVQNSARDVATDQIRIHSFEVGRRRHAAGNNAPPYPLRNKSSCPFRLFLALTLKPEIISLRPSDATRLGL